MSVSVSVSNEKELYSFLKKFPQEITQKVMKKSVRAGAEVTQKEAKRRVPVNTGNLRDSIKIVKRKRIDGNKLSKNEIAYSVIAGKVYKTKTYKSSTGEKTRVKGLLADGWYAHFIEFGTANIPAQSFMRTAIDSTMISSFSKFKEVTKSETNKILAKGIRL